MNIEQVYTKSLSGVRWGLSTQVVIRIASFLPSIILARLLSPLDYGLVGMAGTVAGVVSIFSDFGLGQALLQCQEDVAKRAQQIFWTNNALALILCTIQILLAPAAASFYGTPELLIILRVTALGYVISAVGSVSGILLQKSLNFKSNYLIEIVSTIIRLVLSVSLAWFGWGFWSIILADLTCKLVSAVLKCKLCRWRPSFGFDLQGAGKIFKVGQYIYLTNLLNYFMSNIDFIIIGKFYGAKGLGPYYFSYNLVMMFHQTLSGLTGNITMPAIAALPGQEAARQAYFSRTLKIIAISALPIYGFFVASGPSLINGVFGSKWDEAIVPFVFLSIFGAVRGLVSPFGGYSWATGDVTTPFYWHLVMAPIMAFATFTAAHYGINWVAACAGILYSLCYISFALLIARVQHFKFHQVARIIYSPLMVVVVVAVCIVLIDKVIAAPVLVILIMNVALYGSLIVCGWFFVARDALFDLKRIVAGRVIVEQ